MAIPEPVLDDLRFQSDLVDEARRRIVRYCPEWTEYNLSDPGITLIELFAWMSEQILYRLNQVPEKNYIRFLDMLGVQLQPASSATAELTFRLSAPFPLTPGDDTVAIVPAGLEVATRALPDTPEVIFTTDDQLVIKPPKLAELRGVDFHKNYLPRLGIETFHPFDRLSPRIGDTFYLGFDDSNPLSGQILQISVTCDPSEAAGIRREDPPLVWECSLGDGAWQEIVPSNSPSEKDTTGGLNNPQGDITFYLPLSMKPDLVYGHIAFWIRCRFEQRRKEQGRYSASPRITMIEARTLGSSTMATHAVFVEYEELGVSNGEPGQSFILENRPILALRENEFVAVEEIQNGEATFVPWQLVENFANSRRHDRHFTLDTASGEISFGPRIRQPDGTIRQYGRIPEPGRHIMINRYRYGGGVDGNVPAGQIQVMRSAVPYIDRVTNLKRASGGRDQEELAEAKLRSQRELRAQHRAVTAEDFENLAMSSTRAVARVKCNVPGASSPWLPPGMVELLVVPAAHEALRQGDLSKLALEDSLIRTIESYLDGYRLLSTTIRVREPSYIGVKVKAEIMPSEFSRPEEVSGRVAEVLKLFLSPLPPPADSELPDGILEPDWHGWPMGRNLYAAQIYSLIQQIPGVQHVIDVQIFQRKVNPSTEGLPLGQLEAFASNLVESSANGVQDLELVPSKTLSLGADTILCSFDHEIELSEG